MLFNHSYIESLVIEHLALGPCRTVTLVANIAGKTTATPEAVYLAVRNLRKKRVVVTTKGTTSLYVFWIQQTHKLIESIEQNYNQHYPTLSIFKDISTPSFRSKTLKCADFNAMENTFHHLAQSLIQPQKNPTPYFSFGFAPWWMTLCYEDAEAFFTLLIKYNYIPMLVMVTQYPIDDITVKKLRALGCQIVFVGPTKLPRMFEGHYVHGTCLQVKYNASQYTHLIHSYARATLKDKAHVEALMRQLTGIEIKVAKKRLPFHRSILDLFAVPSGFFRN